MARKKSKLKVSLPKELEKESLEPRDVKKLFEKLFTEVGSIAETLNALGENVDGLSKRLEQLNATTTEQVSRLQVNTAEKLNTQQEFVTESLQQTRKHMENQLNISQEDTSARFNAIMEILLEKEDNLAQSLKQKITTLEDILNSKLEATNARHFELKEQYLSTTKTLEEAYDVLRVKTDTSSQQRFSDLEKFVIEVVGKLMRGYEEKVVAKNFIKDLKEIAKDVDKLKKSSPREFRNKLEAIHGIVEFYATQMKQVK